MDLLGRFIRREPHDPDKLQHAWNEYLASYEQKHKAADSMRAAIINDIIERRKNRDLRKKTGQAPGPHEELNMLTSELAGYCTQQVLAIKDLISRELLDLSVMEKDEYAIMEELERRLNSNRMHIPAIQNLAALAKAAKLAERREEAFREYFAILHHVLDTELHALALIKHQPLTPYHYLSLASIVSTQEGAAVRYVQQIMSSPEYAGEKAALASLLAGEPLPAVPAQPVPAPVDSAEVEITQLALRMREEGTPEHEAADFLYYDLLEDGPGFGIEDLDEFVADERQLIDFMRWRGIRAAKGVPVKKFLKAFQFAFKNGWLY